MFSKCFFPQAQLKRFASNKNLPNRPLHHTLYSFLLRVKDLLQQFTKYDCFIAVGLAVNCPSNSSPKIDLIENLPEIRRRQAYNVLGKSRSLLRRKTLSQGGLTTWAMSIILIFDTHSGITRVLRKWKKFVIFQQLWLSLVHQHICAFHYAFTHFHYLHRAYRFGVQVLAEFEFI